MSVIRSFCFIVPIFSKEKVGFFRPTFFLPLFPKEFITFIQSLHYNESETLRNLREGLNCKEVSDDTLSSFDTDFIDVLFKTHTHKFLGENNEFIGLTHYF